MKKDKKTKKKKNSFIHTIFVFLIVGCVFYFGWPYAGKISDIIKSYINGKNTENQEETVIATPTPDVMNMNGVTLYCRGGIWDELDSDSERIASAKKYVEEKYNVTLKVSDVIFEDPDYGELNPVTEIMNASKKSETGIDIVSIDSDYFYDACSNKIFLDLTKCYRNLGLSSVYTDAATYNRHVYGVCYEVLGDGYVLVYDRNYINELGIANPTEMFVNGKWNYDDFENYLTALYEALPEDVYPIGMSPYKWLVMALGAAGVNMVSDTFDTGLLTEEAVTAVTFYQKLETLGLAFPMEAEYDEYGNLVNLTVADGFDDARIVIKCISVDELREIGDKSLGIIYFPWGENITKDGDYKTLSENYFIPDTSWTITAAVKSSCNEKNIYPEGISSLIYDFMSMASDNGTEWMKSESSADMPVKGEDLFDDSQSAALFDWALGRVRTDFSGKFSAIKSAAYDTLCGYSDPNESFVNWAEEFKQELDNPIVEY